MTAEITAQERKLLDKWTKVSRALSDEEVEIAAYVLGRRYTQKSMERSFQHRKGDPPPKPSFAFRMDYSE